jgi:hypothetical protein
MDRTLKAAAIAAVISSIALMPAAGQSGQSGHASTGNAADKPTLIVLLVADQFRPDYFVRFAGQLHGGLGRLRTRGAFFTNAIQNHALTETAPGHSTMLSGRFPEHTGIYANDAGVPDASSPLIAGATALGASPRRFTGTGLYDWMRASDSTTRALSISRKDRAAILPIGRGRANVFWFADGRFTTSRYYADTLPTWLTEFNAGLQTSAFVHRSWSLLLPASAYSEPDSVSYENGGFGGTTFPHVMTDTAALVFAQLQRFPWMDSVTLAAALRGVRATGVGQRPGHTDLLSISLSTTDAIGHAFGPDSREIHDHVLRLDGWLGAFLDSLALIVPAERTVFAFTADHGVATMPERLTALGRPGGRVDPAPLADSIGAALNSRYGVDFGISFNNGLMFADVDAMRARGVDVEAIRNFVVRRVRAMRGVAAVYTPRSLAAAQNENAAIRWRHSLPSNLGWLVAAVAQPGYVFSEAIKGEHGTMQHETMNVPIVFMGRGIPTITSSREVSTVDIGPTFAALLGIKPTEPVDGRPITEVLGRRQH